MSRRQVFKWCGGVIGAAVLCYSFPLFHIVKIDTTSAERNSTSQSRAGSTALNVPDFADEFWRVGLPNAFGDAVDIGELFDSVDRDPAQTRQEFGRQVGLGGACFLFVRGVGEVEQVAADHCVLKIGRHSRRACIQTGVIVGNAVRDSTGLIDVNRFANSQDFNNLSVELNRRVESDVIGPARERLRVNARVDFVGCGQIESDTDFDPLILVPVKLEVGNREARP